MSKRLGGIKGCDNNYYIFMYVLFLSLLYFYLFMFYYYYYIFIYLCFIIIISNIFIFVLLLLLLYIFLHSLTHFLSYLFSFCLFLSLSLIYQVCHECSCFEDDFLSCGVLGHQDLAAEGSAARLLRLAGNSRQVHSTFTTVIYGTTGTP